MRIALISSLLHQDTRGGAELYVGHCAQSLAERHEVVVLTGSRHDLDGIPIIRLPGYPSVDPDASKLRKVLWHTRDQWLPRVHLAVVRELKRFAPDIVVTHQPQGLSAAVFTAVAHLGLPHVHTAHDLNLLCMRTSMTRGGKFCGGRCWSCLGQRQMRTRAIRLRLDRLVTVSHATCRRHVEAGVVPPGRAVVIRLGAEPGQPRIRKLRENSLALGFIGTLATHKGILTLLRAFGMVREPWRLLIAGSGPLEERVCAAAARDPRIVFLGHVVGPAKEEFFDQLDLLVIPSEWEEPATTVAAEAAVRGVPAIVSARGGLEETPEARPFRSGDAHELLQAVRWFVDEPKRIEESSTRLLARRTDFEWSTHVERIELLLAEVVDERGEAPRVGATPGHARSQELVQ
jgi:glycosyltransferase involved in cell wall biosynthesis